MATEATVTIKVTTSEWDLIRAALEGAKNMAAKQNADTENNDAQTRAAYREKAGQYTDLLRRLS